MKPTIKSEDTLFDGFFKIKQAQIECKHGEEIVQFEQTMMQKKDAVAVLVWNQDTQRFIFVKQYRYPIANREDDFLLEIPAGTIDGTDSPMKTAVREIEEEIGYKANDIEEVMEFYTSSGASSEKVHLFMCITSNKEKISDGGGLQNEGEMLEIVELSIEQVYKMIDLGTIKDAKTIIALQEFKLRHANSDIEIEKEEQKRLLNKIHDLETKLVLLQSKPTT